MLFYVSKVKLLLMYSIQLAQNRSDPLTLKLKSKRMHNIFREI